MENGKVDAKKPCDHYALTFGSSGFYVLCTSCGASWVPEAGKEKDCVTSAVKHPELRIKYGAPYSD